MTPEFGAVLGGPYRDLGERVGRFAAARIEPISIEHADPAAEESLAIEILGRLASEGYLSFTVPPGGTGEDTVRSDTLSAGTNGGRTAPGRDAGRRPAPDIRSIAVIREALAYYSGLADLMFVMQGLGSSPVAIAGSEETRGRWLPQVARGGAIAAIAITEPGAGSDLGSIATTARRDGGDYVLDGMKTLISNAPIADLFSVFARTGEGGGGLTAFAVPASHAGVDRRERLDLICPHPIGTVRFEGCRVPASWRLGEEGEGMKIALATLERFRPTVGAGAIGLAARALEEASRHAETRVQFGRPLSAFGGIRAKIADMATSLEAARLLVYRAASRIDAGEPSTKESSMAKLFATEAASVIVDEAVQITGGLGLVRGTLVERLYREVRALRIYEGTSEIQKLVIAKTLLSDGDR